MKHRKQLLNLLKKRQIRKRATQMAQKKIVTPEQRYDRAMKGI